MHHRTTGAGALALAAAKASAALVLLALTQAQAQAQVHPLARPSWRPDVEPRDALITSFGRGPFDPEAPTWPTGRSLGSLMQIDTALSLGGAIAAREGGRVHAVDPAWDLLRILEPAESVPRGMDVRISFPLPEGNALELELTAYESRGPLRGTWFGRIAGVANSHVVLVQHDDALHASVSNDNPGGRRFEVRPLAIGHLLVEKLVAPAPCGGCGAPAAAASLALPGSSGAGGGGRGSSSSDPTTRVDVLVVAEDNARAVYGSANNFVATAYAMQGDMNLRISFSGGAWTVRVVAAPWDLIQGYADSDDLDLDLNRLTNSTDGFMDQVHARRDDFRPDLVALIVENAGGFGGLAWTLESPAGSIGLGYSVSKRSQAVSGTFAHELGHNLGLCHNANAPTSPGNMNAADCAQTVNGTDRGIERYCDVPDGICGGCEDTEFRTTMAYRVNSSVRASQVQRYSVSGLTATLNGSFGSCTVNLWSSDARAMETLEVTRGPVSAYNVGDTQVWAQWSTAGGGSGTWQDPVGRLRTAMQVVSGGPSEARIRARAGTYLETTAAGGPVLLDEPCTIVPEGPIVIR